jgi:uncharacterized protein YfiM (DUF2279 family)
MMKKFFLCILMLGSVASAHAQQIKSEQVGNKYNYYYEGTAMTLANLAEIMEGNEEAMDYIMKARTNKAFSIILGFSAGVLIGIPVGSALGGGDPNWVLAGVGAGLVLIAIPLSSGVKKNT